MLKHQIQRSFAGWVSKNKCRILQNRRMLQYLGQIMKEVFGGMLSSILRGTRNLPNVLWNLLYQNSLFRNIFGIFYYVQKILPKTKNYIKSTLFQMHYNTPDERSDVKHGLGPLQAYSHEVIGGVTNNI